MYLYPTKLENIEEFNEHIPPKYGSGRKKILRSLVKRRGATLNQIVEDCEDFSREDESDQVSNISVNISMMKKEGLIYSDNLTCHCCLQQVGVHYATEKGKTLIS